MRTDPPSGVMGATPWHLAGDQRPIQQIMKTTVTSYQFVDSFRACGRETQFSRPALFALFDYLEQWEDDTDTELELDPVAICCDFSEHRTGIVAAKEYGQEFSDEEEALEWLRDQTIVIGFDGGIVIQSF